MALVNYTTAPIDSVALARVDKGKASREFIYSLYCYPWQIGLLTPEVIDLISDQEAKSLAVGFDDHRAEIEQAADETAAHKIVEKVRADLGIVMKYNRWFPGDMTENSALEALEELRESDIAAKKFEKYKSELSGNGRHPYPGEGEVEIVGDIAYFKERFYQDETGDSRILADIFNQKMVYDHSLSQWHFFNGLYWEPDRTKRANECVSHYVAAQWLRAAALVTEAGDKELAEKFLKRAKSLGSRRRIANVLELGSAMMALTGDEWDSNPVVVAAENVVIELTTGESRPGRSDEFIRSHAAVEWRGLHEPAPRFERFISEIFEDAPEKGKFMQRLLGYGLSGLTAEHVLPMLCGPEGRNGKSTKLEAIAQALGPDIAISTQADAIMEGGSGNGPRPYIYNLRGKRIVWASESNEGRRLNAGLVKQITGGDRIAVRTLHSKPVEFKPTHLLMLLTNNRPHIPADDDACWERVFLIEFNMRFVDHPIGPNERRRDPRLLDKLIDEGPGILAWLVRGFLEWQRVGLKPPACVRVATEEYRQEEDTLGMFIEERMVIHPETKVKSSAAYSEYSEWCKICGIPAMSISAFGKRMKRRFDSVKSSGIVYLGIGLQADV